MEVSCFGVAPEFRRRNPFGGALFHSLLRIDSSGIGRAVPCRVELCVTANLGAQLVGDISQRPVDVRFGSKADVHLSSANVRFTPNSGHCIAPQRMSALCQKRTHALQQKQSNSAHITVRATCLGYRRLPPAP
jgi:hypothetical protein